MNDRELVEFAYASGLLSSLDRDAESAVESVLAGRRDPAPVLSEAAVQALRESFLAQVKIIYVNALLEKLFREAADLDPVSAADWHRIEPAVLKQAEEILAGKMAPDPVALMRKEFTVIPELEQAIRKNFIAAQTEMLDRVSANLSEISGRFFGGRPVTRIEDLTGMAGDVHRHGRSVAGVKTDAGRFFYKPHDCSTDLLYARLVERFFPDCTVAADCICGGGYGLLSELKRAPLGQKKQLHAYYRNFGMLTALFRAVGTTDMHNENLIPCGVRPAAVDLETLFIPDFTQDRKDDRKGAAEPPSLSDEFAHSVISTAMMPHYTPSLGCCSPLCANVGSQNYLPFIGDKAWPVEGYEEDYIEGFRQGYRRIMENREEILSLLLSCGSAQVRYVLHNTMYYAQLQMQLNRGRFLVSREKREEVLDRLKVVYKLSGAKVNEPVVSYEAACLREGDIPYFCFAFDGKDLCGSSPEEVVIRDYLDRSIRDRIADRLGRMDEKNERFETDLIRCLLRQAPYNILPGRQAAPVARRAAAAPQVLALAGEISRLIGENALHPSNGWVIWYTQVDTMFSIEGGSISAASASVALYNALLAASGLHWSPERADRCLEVIGENLARMMESTPEAVRKYWRPGFSELALCLTACDRLDRAGVKKAGEHFGLLVSLLCEKEVHLQEDPAQLPALAELLIAACLSASPHPRKAEWIGLCAGKLSGFAPGKKTTIAQRASVAAALALAGEQAGNAEWLAAAGRVLASVRSAYREDLKGWPDEKKKFRWASPRGLQAPWIGLCALAAEKAGVPGAAELFRLALDSLADEENLRANDSLYHGNALSVLFLTEAANQGKGTRCAQRAGRILAAMLRRKKEKGAFSIFPENARNAFDAAFVRGTTGIGAAALEWFRFTHGA